MGIQFCFSSKPITIMKSLLFVLSLLPLLTQHPRLSLRPKLTPGTDGTTDGADTTATLTDMDTADTGRGKPRLNPLPLLTPMLKPIPLSSTDLTWLPLRRILRRWIQWWILWWILRIPPRLWIWFGIPRIVEERS